MTFQFALAQELSQYGVPDGHITPLSAEVTPDSLPYSDVISDPWLARHITAVVEDERHPLLYVVHASTLAASDILDEQEIHELAARLACRGSVSYLGVVKLGQLIIYPCQLSQTPIKDAFVTVYADQANAANTFQTLLQGHQQLMTDKTGKTQWTFHQVSDTLRTILLDVCDQLLSLRIYGRQIPDTDEVLALVGRAVFVRFLGDRRIMNAESFPALYELYGGPEAAFDTPAAAALTCTWLNRTLNGELLPLPVQEGKYEPYFKGLVNAHPGALVPLGQIMRKEVRHGMTSLWPLIDFAHVPAGLLSEVYEGFVTKYDKDRAETTSVRYTPQHVAETLVQQAFNGLPHESRHLARVVDPASGAGVFLVTTLRYLVEMHWRATNVRPDARQIRRILYEQICGFDVNHHALILAALSLYLTVIELDPAPKTSDLPFDLVVGNPPWSEWRGQGKQAQRDNATNIARQVITERLPDEAQAARRYKIPDSYSDVPFLWRAMQLAKPGGVIALLLHSHLLFGSNTETTRMWLARTLRVHGVLNLSSFSNESQLWATRQPFFMLFARNEVPVPTDPFWYVSPYLDLALAQRGRVRIEGDPVLRRWR